MAPLAQTPGSFAAGSASYGRPPRRQPRRTTVHAPHQARRDTPSSSTPTPGS